MITAALLLFAAQQTPSVSEMLAMPWEGNERFVYSQVLDAEVDSDVRAALAEYAIVFDGHFAIDSFRALIDAETTPSLLHSLLREWQCCVQAGDRELLLTIAEQTQTRTAFLALRNLVSLCETASDYIPLVDLAAERDAELAQRLLTYLPRLDDDGSFRDYLSSQLSVSNATHRASMLSKAAEYHTPQSFLKLYQQRVSSADLRQQAEWMPVIARQTDATCKAVAAEWFLKTQNADFTAPVVAVSRALANSNCLDGDEGFYMQHPLMTNQQASTLLMSRIADSLEAESFAVEHLDEFPSIWQTLFLEAFSSNADSVTLQMANTVAMSMRYKEDVRAAAIRLLGRQSRKPAVATTLLALFNEDWSSYEVADALIECAIEDEVASPRELLTSIDRQSYLSDMKEELRQVVYKRCATQHGDEHHNFIVQSWAAEVVNMQALALTEFTSLAAVARENGNFSQAVDTLVAHAAVNPAQLLAALRGMTVNSSGAVLLVYTAALMRHENTQVAQQLLTKALHAFGDGDGYAVWKTRAWCLGAQLAESEAFALHSVEQLLLNLGYVEDYQFAIREGFAPQGAGWHDLEAGIRHRKIFLNAIVTQQPMSCAKLRGGQVEAELLLRAAQMLSSPEYAQRQDVLLLAVGIAQHAVDLSPYSIAAHQQLVNCNYAAQVDSETSKIAVSRLRRLQTNSKK
jgi:hypothetical protein